MGGKGSWVRTTKTLAGARVRKQKYTKAGRDEREE